MVRMRLPVCLCLVVLLLGGAGADENAYDVAGVLAPGTDLSEPQDDLPKCGTATNCLTCFQQQECYANPFGSQPICSPCGWCSNGTSKGDSLMDDVKGLCAMAPTGIVDFCPWIESPSSHLFCPVSVCTVGDFGCSCTGNQCPAVERLAEWLAIEVVYFIVFLLFLTFFSCVALFVRALCLRRQSRLLANGTPVVVVPFGNFATTSQVVMGSVVGETPDYARMK